MLQTNELRRGNWVKAGRIIEQVIDVMCDSITTIAGTRLYDDIEPITLTPEILSTYAKQYIVGDFDIQITEDGWQFKLQQTDEWDVWYGKYDDWKRSLPLCSIKYLHQLQNLYFAVVGTELKCF